MTLGVFDKRTERLAKYKVALEEWEQAIVPFSTVQVSPFVGDWNDNHTETHILVKQYADPDGLLEDKYTELPEYEPCFYEEFIPFLDFNVTASPKFDTDKTLMLKLHLAGPDFEENIVTVQPLQLFRVKELPGKFPSGCQTVQGYFSWRSLKCFTLWVRST